MMATTVMAGLRFFNRLLDAAVTFWAPPKCCNRDPTDLDFVAVRHVGVVQDLEQPPCTM